MNTGFNSCMCSPPAKTNGEVSKVFGDSESQQRNIRDKLIDREKLGSTILHDQGIILLHCRSEVIKEPQIGVIRLKNKIKDLFIF